MEGSYLPKALSMAAASISEYNCNTVRMEVNAPTPTLPSQIITIQLPSTLVDLKSFKLNMKATTTSAGSGNDIVYGKLPSDAGLGTIFSNIEILVGGVQVVQGHPDSHLVSKVLKIVKGNTHKDMTTDRLLHHGSMETTTDAVNSKSFVFQFSHGFMAENSARFMPFHLLGDALIRLTVAPASVLGLKQHGLTVSTNFSSAALASAPSVTYSLSDMYATIKTVSFGNMYEQLLLTKLAQDEYIPIRYKSYALFQQHGINSSSHELRASYASSSIDALYACWRMSNHSTAGVKSRAIVGQTLSDAHVANAFFLQSFGSGQATGEPGAFKYQWNVGNVLFPQFLGSTMDAAHDLLMEKSDTNSIGAFITSPQAYQNGLFVVPLRLNCPGEPVSVKSGYNSLGQSTPITLQVNNQVMPTESETAQIVDTIQGTIIVESTQELRVAGARQLSVVY